MFFSRIWGLDFQNTFFQNCCQRLQATAAAIVVSLVKTCIFGEKPLTYYSNNKQSKTYMNSKYFSREFFKAQ